VLDNEYVPQTLAAVVAFQKMNRLVADGTVGPLTAKKLGVTWPMT
jgi:peptidoglycan hydrolase-like protein with peptidoglycan-binding domain